MVWILKVFILGCRRYKGQFSPCFTTRLANEVPNNSEFGRLRQKCDTVVGRKGKDAPRRLVAARSIKNRKEGIVETLARLDKDIAELREAYLVSSPRLSEPSSY